MNDPLRDRRVQYETDGLDIGDVLPDPAEQWQRWHSDAFEAGVAEPNAMTLSTVALDGGPDGRIVLVRAVDADGIVFYTNYESAKSKQIDADPRAAATFAWLDLHRQVRVRGRMERVSAEQSDAYFATRPRASQLGAWSSPQSEVIADRSVLDDLVRQTAARFDEGDDIPRPDNWGGWRLVADEWEFWQGRPSRLHDRLRYRPGAESGTWTIDRLAP